MSSCFNTFRLEPFLKDSEGGLSNPEKIYGVHLACKCLSFRSSAPVPVTMSVFTPTEWICRLGVVALFLVLVGISFAVEGSSWLKILIATLSILGGVISSICHEYLMRTSKPTPAATIEQVHATLAHVEKLAIQLHQSMTAAPVKSNASMLIHHVLEDGDAVCKAIDAIFTQALLCTSQAAANNGAHEKIFRLDAPIWQGRLRVRQSLAAAAGTNFLALESAVSQKIAQAIKIDTPLVFSITAMLFSEGKVSVTMEKVEGRDQDFDNFMNFLQFLRRCYCDCFRREFVILLQTTGVALSESRTFCLPYSSPYLVRRGDLRNEEPCELELESDKEDDTNLHTLLILCGTNYDFQPVYNWIVVCNKRMLMTAMDALPAELVAPIVKLVNPVSLSNLKSILRPNTPWSLSVDHALEPRFDLYVTVLYLRGFDCMQLHVNKKMQDGRIVSYAPQDDDAYNIDGLMFTVGQTQPGLSSFYSHLVRSRADCLARVREALQLMNSARRLDITIEHLDEQPGDLLDLPTGSESSVGDRLDSWSVGLVEADLLQDWQICGVTAESFFLKLSASDQNSTLITPIRAPAVDNSKERVVLVEKDDARYEDIMISNGFPLNRRQLVDAVLGQVTLSNVLEGLIDPIESYNID
uniref:Response regulatory domain-containing protein n=1 Tax=Steinernema glaseri TaxID=37863 RepID=A0A1I8AQK7_9BILA